MKTLYIECNMGAAGDMLMAALSELLPDTGAFLDEINRIGLHGVRVERETRVKCGIAGTGMRVMIEGEEEGREHPDGGHHSCSHGVQDDSHHHHIHEHHEYHEHSHDGNQVGHHNGMQEILHMISHLHVSDAVKRHAGAVYALLAEAECFVHQTDMKDIHFHEVGTMDAVADIVGVCMLMEKIGPDRVVVSPIHTGSGHVHCAHGVLPVPAPATAKLLEGMPSYSTEVKGELCTPTGAALLKYFADGFGPRPVMMVKKNGYGMGKKDFPMANCVRVFLGEDMEQNNPCGPNDKIAVLSCNLDDMTGEALGFAQEMLFDAGAMDVYTTSIQMKKSRPGQMLSCICRLEDADRTAALMLKHTTSFGVRRQICDRYKMDIQFEERETSYGTVNIKSGGGYGEQKSKPEYEDLCRIAREHGLTIEEVKRLL